MLGCTLQANKPCTFPAWRPSKEPEVSNRDINSLMDGGAYMSEAESWRNTPPCTDNSRQDMVAVFTPREKGRPVIEQLIQMGWSVTREISRRTHLPHLFDKNNHKLGPEASMYKGQSCEQGVDETGTGQAWGVQRAREQLRPWPYILVQAIFLNQREP